MGGKNENSKNFEGDKFRYNNDPPPDL